MQFLTVGSLFGVTRPVVNGVIATLSDTHTAGEKIFCVAFDTDRMRRPFHLV